MGKINLTLLEKKLKAVFYMEYEKTESPLGSFVLPVRSDADSELYDFLAIWPEINEWLDSRQIQRMKDFGYTIRHKKYEGTIAVPVDDINDSKVAGHTIAARQLGAAAAEFFIDRTLEMLEAGESENCFDGKKFFAANHKINKEAVWSNLHTGTGTTLAQLKADLNSTVTAILRLKTPNGKTPFFKRSHKMTVIAPPELKNTFNELLNKEIYAGGESNELYGLYDLVVFPQLTDVNDWYIAVSDMVAKGMILQTREDPAFQRQAGTGGAQDSSDHTFMYDEILFGTKQRGNVGYGWPQLLHKVKNT